MALNQPWQAPSPAVIEGPASLGNRTIGPSIGNAYGAAQLAPPIPPFTPGVMGAVAKQEVINMIDAWLSLFPYDYSVTNGIVRIELRHHRDGIAIDPRPGAPALDPIAAQNTHEEGTTDVRYGGHPSWYIDWDRAGMSIETIEKMLQFWYNAKLAVAAI